MNRGTFPGFAPKVCIVVTCVVVWPVEPSQARLLGVTHQAGLIVGEGSFIGDSKQPALQVKLDERDPRPLYYLQALFGGRIYGPYFSRGRRSRLWILRGWELWNALPVLLDNMPPSHKREQLEAWSQRYGLTSRTKGRLFGARSGTGP